MTLLLSYLIFTKPLTEQHGTGLLLIAMGIVLKMLPADNNPPKRSPPTSDTQPKHENASQGEDNRLQIGNEEEEEKRPFV